ncbi:AFG1-like ATPase-domain-containing protein [Russula emetica]|nr:AFG1-like ATPase-domain-containing protein [Russula emetica]
MHVAKAAGAGDPLLPVARDLADEAHALCLDEFQVMDIADAMIVRRLLDALLEHGVVCVLTSNRHPDDLYKNGIQRTSFLPAIDLLKTQFDVTALIRTQVHYRRVPRALSHGYFSPLDGATRATIDVQFAALTEGTPIHFAELCGRALGAPDCLKITQRFRTLFVKDVPRMGLSEKDDSFTFIDACCDSRTGLFVSSEVPIFEIFSDYSNTGPRAPPPDHMRAIMDELVRSHHLPHR